MRAIALAISLLATGCGSYYQASAHAAAEGALEDLTGPAASARYAAVAATAAQAGAAAARAELLSASTATGLTAIVKDVGIATRAEVASTLQTAGAGARGELTQTFVAEQRQIQQMVRLTIDEAFGAATLRQATALREEFAGAPLQADVGALIDSAAPHLAAAAAQALTAVVAPVQAAADREAGRWKPIAIGFAVGCALLCVCLGFAGWLVREHQRTIRALTARAPPK